MEGEVLQIPIRGAEEVVTVRVEDLQEDPSDIVDILKAELAPLELWLELALIYFKKGNINAFKAILQEGADPALETHYPDSKAERIAIVNSLAGYYTTYAAKQKDKTIKAEFFSQANLNILKAEKINIADEMTWVGKGVLILSRADIPRAITCFDNALRVNPKCIPGLLGKVFILIQCSLHCI